MFACIQKTLAVGIVWQKFCSADDVMPESVQTKAAKAHLATTDARHYAIITIVVVDGQL